MAPLPTLKFQALGSTLPENGVVVAFAEDEGTLPLKGLVSDAVYQQMEAVAAAVEFKGKAGKSFEVIAPVGTQLNRIIIVGMGKRSEMKSLNWLNLGGTTYGKLPAADYGVVSIIAKSANLAFAAQEVALLTEGLFLRAYNFDNYKTKRKEGEVEPKQKNVHIYASEHKTAEAAFAGLKGQAEGVMLARELVNLPPNVLYPAEFVKRTQVLTKLGVEIEVLSQAQLEAMGFNALTAVGRGSTKDSHVVIMKWNGNAASKEAPLCFVGKGVTFDTGGISIKPSNSMEDMKGDMGGAACVTGLMYALASRKAPVNVIGAIGLVENMPDGDSYRPGDIVTSLSGQTIEIINTDAEGRLVLADVLWYVGQTYKPKFIIDLATLTGAILVALGTEYAGLFSNQDELSNAITAAGLNTGEKVWRLPMSPDYDKIIDSKFADVKNSGNRNGGSITAAQFLKRFVPNDIPWAHIDVAGTAMDSPASDINTSWGSGWGVRLLDEMVRASYEPK